MKKANRNFKVMNKVNKLDFTHEGFAIDHEKKVLLVLDQTDRAIKSGNVALLLKFIELMIEYTDYKRGVLYGARSLLLCNYLSSNF